MQTQFQGGTIMDHLPMVFAYLGPETMLPMTSVVAGIAGFAMMFGRNAWSWLSKTVRSLKSRETSQPETTRRLRRIGTGPVGRIDRVEATREQVQS
jgi:hypothetical protein